MKRTKIHLNNKLSWEDWNYAWNLEKEWQKSLPRFSDREWLEIFPEVKNSIPKLIKEWEEKRNEIREIIRKKLTLIKSEVSDEFGRWFWREWIKINEGEELLKVETHIARLKKSFLLTKNKVLKGEITEEEIQRALSVPIESLVVQPLKKCGKALVGLCPFHMERHPSFYIYPETNTCWCYGCNRGGNVISFVMLLYGYSFKEAVKYLINH